MNTKQRFDVISNGRDNPSVPTRRAKHPVAVAIAVLAIALLVAAAEWMQPDRGSEQRVASPEAKGDSSVSAEFEYFPDKYVNQAKDPEEHIQAF